MNPLPNRLALGTVQFGLNYGISNATGKPDTEEVLRILNAAWNGGIRMLDTARAYGESEQTIGAVNSFNFNIVTKIPATVKSQKELDDSLRESLKALKADKLYGLMTHNAEILLQQPILWETLKEVRSKGLTSKIGYSIYRPDDLSRLLDRKMIPDIIQVPYNILDRRFEPFFSVLKGYGTEIYARSAFLQGLFFLKPEDLSLFFEPLFPFIKKLHELVPDKNKLAASLLKWVLSNNAVDYVLFGVSSASELNFNLKFLNESKDELGSLFIPAFSEEILSPNLWPSSTKRG